MITKYIRPELLSFKSYNPSQTLNDISEEIGVPMEKIIKIDSGENIYAEKLLDKKLLSRINFSLYPDPACTILREKLADYTGYGSDFILCGNGSDELIDLLIRTFVSAGEEIIISPPTFPMYEFYGQLSGAKVKSVLRNKKLNIDTKKIIKKITAKTKIIFLDSPGNPTSVITSRMDIELLLKKKIIVVVDEAYFEYCNQTVLQLVKKYQNLVVLRTLSKWAGLAGLRVGYAIANPEIINIMLAIKPPYNVNSVAQETAIIVLNSKDKYLNGIQQLVNLRNEFIENLSKFPYIKVFPSQGAYIIFKPKSKTALIQEFLKKNGILVKVINQQRLENCIRINLMERNDMNKFIFQLRRFYEN